MPTIDQHSRRRVLTALGSCVGGVLAGCVGMSNPTPSNPDASTDTVGEWPTVGRDPSNTRYASGETTITSTPTVAWRLRIGSPVHQPVVADGQVYIPDGAVLRVHDAATGDERWTYTDAKPLTAPTVRDGVVYVGVMRGTESVVALDATKGKPLWTFGGRQAGGVSGTPTLDEAGDRLYIGTNAERIYALDATSGDPHWQQEVFGPVTTTLSVRSPLVAVTTRSGEVYAFNESGAGLWRLRLPQGSESPPVISDRTVFAGGTDNRIYSLDPVSGRLRWDTTVKTLYQGGFVVKNASVYAVSGRGITALGGKKGKIQWNLNLGAFPKCAPMLLDDTLYVGGTRLFAIKSSGGVGVEPLRFNSTRWSVDLGEHVGPGIAATTDRLFVPVALEDGTHELLALEAAE